MAECTETLFLLVQCVVIVGSNLTIEIGDRTLLTDASFVVGEGEKVGLVGRNGTGKSSFISVLVGERRPPVAPSGQRAAARLLRLPAPGPGARRPGPRAHRLLPHPLGPRPRRARRRARARPARRWPTTRRDANIELFTDLQDKFQTSGGYEAEAVMARLADGLGLRQELLFEDVDELSGGQRRRVDLVRVLFQEPELMILDEPTNHLDRSAKRWLLDELARFPGALLVVSHDLKLLDHSITKVLHISNQRLTEWKGNYSKFQAQHEADQTQRERASELEQREIKRLSTLADSMRASTEKRARKAKQLDRRVERMEATRTQVDKRERASKFKLPVPPRVGAIPLEVAKLGVRYGNNEVLTNVNFHAGRGDHIVIIGRNGAGKSSLLRCLAGVQDPSNGVVELGANVVLGYFAQEHEQIDPDPHRAGQRERRRAQAGEGPARPARLVRAAVQGGGPDAGHAVGRRARQAGSGHAVGRRGQRAAARRAHQQPRPVVDHRGRHHAGRLARHHRRREPRARLRRGAAPDLLPAPTRGALHPLARGVPRRRRDALTPT